MFLSKTRKQKLTNENKIFEKKMKMSHTEWEVKWYSRKQLKQMKTCYINKQKIKFGAIQTATKVIKLMRKNILMAYVIENYKFRDAFRQGWSLTWNNDIRTVSLFSSHIRQML